MPQIAPCRVGQSLPRLRPECQLGTEWTASFKPVVVETPWGQRVVTIDTYIEIQTYEQLRPGQDWATGETLAKKLRDDYSAGRLKLRRYPWRAAEGLYVLGRDNMEQQIYLLDTGQGLLLIDPSFDAWQGDVVAEIHTLGYDPSQVKWVCYTATSTTASHATRGTSAEQKSSPAMPTRILLKAATRSWPPGSSPRRRATSRPVQWTSTFMMGMSSTSGMSP